MDTIPDDTVIAGKRVYYHIYNKGIEDRSIFNDSEDYDVFLRFVNEYLSFPQNTNDLKTTFEINGHAFQGVPHLPKNYYKDIILMAYNLSATHFHLLLKETTPGSIGKFMRSLCTRYAIYYNAKYKHTGTIFHGTFQSRIIPTVKQVELLSYYINGSGERTSYHTYSIDDSLECIPVETILTTFNIDKESYIQKVFAGALKESEMNSLKNILLPCGTDHLEKKNLTRGAAVNKNRQRNVFLTFALFGFLFLSGISTRNILFQRKTTTVAAGIRPSEYPTNPPAGGPTSQPLFAHTESEPDVLAAQDVDTAHSVKLQVRITGDALRVNIRSNPLVDAPIIAKAYNGDILESTDKIDNWHAVKLPDGEIGYILSSNVVEVQ